jgi:hypothetical protein
MLRAIEPAAHGPLAALRSALPSDQVGVGSDAGAIVSDAANELLSLSASGGESRLARAVWIRVSVNRLGWSSPLR